MVQTLSQERGHHGIAQVSSQCLVGTKQLSKLTLRLLNTCCLISWKKDISPSSECGRESASETTIHFERTVEVPLKCLFLNLGGVGSVATGTNHTIVESILFWRGRNLEHCFNGCRFGEYGFGAYLTSSPEKHWTTME